MFGQLGLGHSKDCILLARVETVSGTILQVAASEHHTFMLTDQGLYACGRNQSGQLGLGYNNHCYQLTRVEGLRGTILQVVAGYSHTLVLPVELKQWLSQWRQLNYLIALSTSDATHEQDEPGDFPSAAKCTNRL